MEWQKIIINFLCHFNIYLDIFNSVFPDTCDHFSGQTAKNFQPCVLRLSCSGYSWNTGALVICRCDKLRFHWPANRKLVGRPELFIYMCPSKVGPEVSRVSVWRQSGSHEWRGIKTGNLKCQLWSWREPWGRSVLSHQNWVSSNWELKIVWVLWTMVCTQSLYFK